MTSLIKTMTIQVNGQKESIDEGMTIQSFLLSKKANPNAVACELNQQIVRRPQWDKMILKEGDSLEIIRMMGGG
ncbi:MAG: sulfur carrier protein ThiS [Elusimicrobia bacterium]|nr:sulfur carrier protein ThiS [Candidatus Obscuribacterium magneticum]